MVSGREIENNNNNNFDVLWPKAEFFVRYTPLQRKEPSASQETMNEHTAFNIHSFLTYNKTDVDWNSPTVYDVSEYIGQPQDTAW